jgi:DNA-binding response OmpR family regulator
VPEPEAAARRRVGSGGAAGSRGPGSSPGGASVKIICVTASAFEEDRRKALEAGADDFLAKPFREAVLFEKIGKLLGVEYVLAEKPSSSSDDSRPAAMNTMKVRIAKVAPVL